MLGQLLGSNRIVQPDVVILALATFLGGGGFVGVNMLQPAAQAIANAWLPSRMFTRLNPVLHGFAPRPHRGAMDGGRDSRRPRRAARRVRLPIRAHPATRRRVAMTATPPRHAGVVQDARGSRGWLDVGLGRIAVKCLPIGGASSRRVGLSGRELGALVAISEHTTTPPPAERCAEGGAAAEPVVPAPPVQPGQQEVVVRVQARWSLD